MSEASKLIEELSEEVENCYGKETELTERAREYLNRTKTFGEQISSTVLAMLCELSSKYEGSLIVDENGIEIHLRCKRPNLAISKKISKQEMVYSRLRQDKIVELTIKQAAEELDDKVEQTFRRR